MAAAWRLLEGADLPCRSERRVNEATDPHERTLCVHFGGFVADLCRAGRSRLRNLVLLGDEVPAVVEEAGDVRCVCLLPAGRRYRRRARPDRGEAAGARRLAPGNRTPLRWH